MAQDNPARTPTVDLRGLDDEAGYADDRDPVDQTTEGLVEQVLENVESFTDDQVQDLLVTLQQRGVKELEYDATFDIYSFLNQQIRNLRVMQARVVSADGSPRSVGTSKDMKDFMNAAKSLGDTMLKHQKELITIARIQKIETATRQALAEVEPELVDKFIDHLEDLLREDE